MQENFKLARERLGIITAIFGEAVGSLIALAFYFTILVPFALLARLGKDPLNRAVATHDTYWQARDPISNALDKAKRQG